MTPGPSECGLSECRGQPMCRRCTAQKHPPPTIGSLEAQVAALRSTVDRMLSVARARAAHEASAAVHHAGRWHNAFEYHMTRLAAMHDVIAAIEAAHKEPR